MKLYKYVSPERIDILLKGQIRFSQPSAWNDPFEVQPYYKDHKSLNPFQRLFELSKLINHLIETNNLPSIEEYKKVGREITKDDIYSFIHRNIVGLFLTEDKENLLMWAHYASNHTGFIIEFDTNNNFFHNIDKYLFRVACDNKRPELNKDEFASLIVKLVGLMQENKKIPEDYFNKISYVFRKSLDWEYEKEWRLITTTDKAINYKEFKKNINVIPFGGDNELNRGLYGADYIAKLEIPISCIKAIYCGKRMKRRKVRKLFFLTKYNSNFSHINLMGSEIDDKLYKINCEIFTRCLHF